MYTELTISITEQEHQEIMAALLLGYGFEGVEELPDALKAFIEKKSLDEDGLKQLLNETELFKNSTFTLRDIPEQNWNEAWEKSFQPVVVAGKVRIRASFHPVDNNILYELLIDPQMSFGTGHHETTQLMLEMMLGMDFAGKSILDFGSGTGVLSILAEKMGADAITSVDFDEWAYNNIVENMEKNGARKITPLLGSVEVIPEVVYDVILANVNKNIISESLDLLSSKIKTGGTILFSGLLEADEPEIIEKSILKDLKLKEKKIKNEWLCLKLTKQ